jgi:hypothetical protein
MKRRCFVVSGHSWARLFALVEQDDLGCPIWTRLEVVSDRTRRRGAPAAAPVAAPVAGTGGGDDGRRFAGTVIRAAGAAMRSTGADELVLLGPPGILAGLNLYRSMLARHGIKTISVPMSLDLLARHMKRKLLGGAVTRSFSFASATLALTQAA